MYRQEGLESLRCANPKRRLAASLCWHDGLMFPVAPAQAGAQATSGTKAALFHARRLDASLRWHDKEGWMSAFAV
jgi:hypothetical protein